MRGAHPSAASIGDIADNLFSVDAIASSRENALGSMQWTFTDPMPGAAHVRLWHISTFLVGRQFRRCRGQSGHPGGSPKTTRMTRSDISRKASSAR